MKQQMVRIFYVIDRFLWEPFWFFQSIIFVYIRSDMTEEQEIINLSSHDTKIYASLALSDFEVTFWGERKDTAFR